MSERDEDSGIQVKATNRKALRDFHVEEKMEAGVVLVGSEIKSIRDGKANLRDSYATIEGGEAWLYDMHISPYGKSSHFTPDPRRKRKLLLHKGEIKRLTGKIIERGYTLVPLRLYLRNGKAKLELGLAKGKRQYDRRREIEKRDADREMERAIRWKGRSL